MKRLLAVAVAMLVWCATSWATTWTPSGPGGGGNFTTVDVATDNGTVLVGSDVSGMYTRTNNTNSWTHIGEMDGLTATKIFSVQFHPGDHTLAIAGTSRGLFRLASGSWSRPPGSQSPDHPPAGYNVSAVGYDAGGDCFAAYNAGGFGADSTIKTDSCLIRMSSNDGATWFAPQTVVQTTWTSPGIYEDPQYEPIKVATDPNTSGSTRVIYVLLGINLDSQANSLTKGVAYDSSGKHPGRSRSLYQSRDNGATWRRLNDSNGDGSPATVIDFAVDSSAVNHLAIVVSRSGYATKTSAGKVLTTTDAGANNISWSVEPVDDTNYPAGAIWYKYHDLFLLTVAADPCGTASGDGAGVWVKHSDSWSRVDDGRNGGSWTGSVVDDWESGWDVVGSGTVPCKYRYGQTIANAAASVSQKGEYRVTASFVWHYDWGAATGRGYRSSFTNSGSGPYNGKQVDNVNPAALLVDGSSVWVGFYDIGLWKYVPGTGWENHNFDAAIGAGGGDWGWDGNGGNVNGIVKDGSTMYVTAAASSKGGSWDVYANSTSGFPASGWSRSHSFSEYLRSLSINSGNGKLWLVHAGKVASSTGGSTWTDAPTGGSDLASDGRYSTVLAHNAFVVVGGTDGIWTSNNYGVSGSWTHTLDLGAFGGDATTIDHKEVWTGIHDIFWSLDGNRWYATAYGPYTTDTTHVYPYGLYASSDANASSWRLVRNQLLRRGVYVDSCGARVHVTSAAEFSSGPSSNVFQFTDADGCETCRYKNGDPLLDSLACTPDVGNGSSDFPADAAYRNRFGGRVTMYTSTSAGKLYVGAPGYGLMYYALNEPSSCIGGGGCHEPCEMEGPGHPGGDAAHLAREEGVAPKLPRTMFSVAEARALVKAGQLELYDVSGRRTRTPSSGVYFAIERDKAGVVTARRAVLVTP